MKTVPYAQFDEVELRAGTIIRAEVFPEARKPAYKLWVDFGDFGVRQSSAQITVRYTPEGLIGTQVVGVINFEPKRIAGFESQCLICGFEESPGVVILTRPDHPVPNGAKLF